VTLEEQLLCAPWELRKPNVIVVVLVDIGKVLVLCPLNESVGSAGDREIGFRGWYEYHISANNVPTCADAALHPQLVQIHETALQCDS
jgi:hypothetical protein